jgi:N-acyl homoserine lactone hydrolase
MSTWRVELLLEGTPYSSSVTLVENGQHRVLVDTSLSLQARALTAALAARGLEPADIDLIINTHLHVDHCGNNAVFPRAAIFLSRDEWQWTSAFYAAIFASRTPERVAPAFYPELPSYQLPARTIRSVARMARLLWSAEHLGSSDRFRWLETTNLPAGLEVVSTPGHTPHHVSIRVASAGVVLAGDAVLAEDVDARVRTMIPHSRDQYLKTREALLRAGEAIVPGHGRLFQPSVAELGAERS